MNDAGDEKHAALFATLILQQSNMALLLMGKIPDPTTGKAQADLDKATLFIDMLAMLEARTKGNLSDDESRMLKDTLTQLRMTYVEATKAPAPSASASPVTETAESVNPAESEAGPADAKSSPEAPAAAAPEAEEASRKKFTKKY